MPSLALMNPRATDRPRYSARCSNSFPRYLAQRYTAIPIALARCAKRFLLLEPETARRRVSHQGLGASAMLRIACLRIRGGRGLGTEIFSSLVMGAKSPIPQ